MWKSYDAYVSCHRDRDGHIFPRTQRAMFTTKSLKISQLVFPEGDTRPVRYVFEASWLVQNSGMQSRVHISRADVEPSLWLNPSRHSVPFHRSPQNTSPILRVLPPIVPSLPRPSCQSTNVQVFLTTTCPSSRNGKLVSSLLHPRSSIMQ
jgi:hypothetical protein